MINCKHKKSAKNKTMTLILLFSILLISASLYSSTVEAKKAAYIYRNTGSVNQRILNIMSDMNFTVDLINNADANSTNFTQYNFIYVGNEYFQNPLDIPVNKMPALLMNTWNMNSWSWSTATSQVGGTNPTQLIVQVPNHKIVQGLYSPITIYTQGCYTPDCSGVAIPVYFLSRFDKSPYLSTITYPNIAFLTSYDGAIVTAVNGTNLLSGKKSSAKGVFFGIFETLYWTADSETLFRNSIEWLTADEAPPIISITAPTNRTYNSNNISLEFTVSEAVLWCGYKLDSGPVDVLNNPSTNMSTTFFAGEGSHNLLVLCNDTSSNQGQTSVSFSIDTIPPSINILSPQQVTYTYQNVPLNATTDLAGTCTYSLNGNANQTLAGNGTTWASSMIASEGSNNLVVYCKDGVENWNSAIRTFAVDTLPPLITLNSPTSTNYPVNNISILYSANEQSNCSYNVDNSGAVGIQGNASILVLEGNHNFLFACTDLFNHTSNVQVNFSVTTIPPDAPVNLTANYNSTNKNIYLTWNKPAGAYSYNVYSSGSPNISSFNFSNPLASTTSLQWQDDLANSTQQKYYVARAKNSAGVEENNTFKVGKFDIQLYQGMNLVSLPLIPRNNSIQAILHQTNNSYLVIEISSRKQNGQYEISTFYPDFPPSYWWSADNFYTLQNGRGYWFKSNSDYNFTLTGEIPALIQQVQLYDGMNLVGWTSVNSKKLWDAIKQNATNYNVIEVSGRKQNGQYDIATFYQENPPNFWWSADNFDTLAPGNGYWLKSNSNSTWLYDPK